MLATRVRIGVLSSLVLSAIFAALMTAVATFELFMPALMPQYGRPSRVVMRVPYAARVVRVGKGQLFDVQLEHRRTVVPLGTMLEPGVEEHRAAVNYDATRRPPTATRIGSSFILYFIGSLVLTNYALRFGHGRLRLLRSQIGLAGLLLAVFAVSKALLLYTTLPAFWLPGGALALWVAASFDRRTGVLVDLAASFLIASLTQFDVMLVSVLVTRGVVAALFLVNRKQPRQMVFAGLAGGVAAAVGYVALSVVFDGEADVFADLALGLGSELIGCVGGGLAAGVIANLGREQAELALGHVSRTRLLDLTDIEAPLLRKMATEAPGSWEHSRTMANLAEAAAASIGADALLTRVGAYYHDLGKTVQPKYFVENLLHGESSPHLELAPEISADAIMAHVVMGAKILRQGGVPEPVVEFAYTHHGTQLVEFFWNKYLEATSGAPGERKHDESHFRYPGMKPMTKETAILMLVDSIEAASRTVDPPTHAKFEEMIRRVVFHKLSSGQLDESGLTLVDLRVMAARMAAGLVNMSHGRVKYPWQRENEPRAPRPAGAKDGARAMTDAPSEHSETC